jgi:hypothetical protein
MALMLAVSKRLQTPSSVRVESCRRLHREAARSLSLRAVRDRCQHRRHRLPIQRHLRETPTLRLLLHAAALLHQRESRRVVALVVPRALQPEVRLQRHERHHLVDRWLLLHVLRPHRHQRLHQRRHRQQQLRHGHKNPRSNLLATFWTTATQAPATKPTMAVVPAVAPMLVVAVLVRTQRVRSQPRLPVLNSEFS